MKNKGDSIYTSVVRGSVVAAISRFISPLFLVMFIASFIFWFVAKLGYSYTTELEVNLRIEDQKFNTTCVVEGVGTNLLGYHIYKGGAVKLNINDLKHRVVKGGDGESYIRIDNSSLSHILSVHYSDIKLVSVETPSDVLYTQKIRESLKK